MVMTIKEDCKYLLSSWDKFVSKDFSSFYEAKDYVMYFVYGVTGVIPYGNQWKHYFKNPIELGVEKH